MTEDDGGPWVGDLVHDMVVGKTATLSDVRAGGTYVLRARGGAEWYVEDPGRLEIITKRQDRTEWPFPGYSPP